MKAGWFKALQIHHYFCLSHGLMEQCEEEHSFQHWSHWEGRGGALRGWRPSLERQDLVIPYCFLLEGSTSLKQTAEGSGALGPVSNLRLYCCKSVKANGLISCELRKHIEDVDHQWAQPKAGRHQNNCHRDLDKSCYLFNSISLWLT